MKIFYRFTCAIFKAYFRIFYRHKVYGQKHVISGKAIIAPNHTSFLDPPLIAISWPEEVSFLARKTLFSSSLFASLIHRLNAYPVSGTAQDLSSFKLISQLLQENKKVVIFPEGVRSLDGNISSIKSGVGMLAMRNQCPIIPVYIHGCYEIWNRTRRFPKLFGKTACVFGSPVDWKQFNHLEKKKAQEMIGENVRSAIQGLKAWYEAGAIGSPP